MRRALKRLVIFTYCHGVLSATAVALVFRHFDLQGA